MKAMYRFLIPAVRLVLGGMFLFSGLNGFFQFMPMGQPEGAVGAMMGGLAASGYFFPLLFATQSIVGVLLLWGRLVPLALTVLAPIMVNIVAFHVFLAPDGLVMAVALGLMQLYLAYVYRDAFAGLLRLKTTPKWTPAEERPDNAPMPDMLEETT